MKRLLVFAIISISLVCLMLFYKKQVISHFLTNLDFSKLSIEVARKIAPEILDAASIPNGDISIASNKAYSKRYIISKWQRAAIGSSVIVFGKDSQGDLCVALGEQGGLLRNPQGYMEISLPREDTTGMKQQHASRMNIKTMELVKEDNSLEDCAVREVYEEIGLTISKNDLVLLNVISQTDLNPITFAVQFMVLLDTTPPLVTYDEEFMDDLKKPMWIKVKNLKYNYENKGYFSVDYSAPIDIQTINGINI